MPPVRNLATPKPLKTERTHEENQERAYIAASRRSDRSIEARLESAKRASEVHKKRTGRALRITQEDVENEEMYEEEDSDLQLNFRNLAAQWYASSPEFNRKLQAYLASQSMTNNVAATDLSGNSVGAQPPQYVGNPFLAQLVQQRLPPQNPAFAAPYPPSPAPASAQTGHIHFPTSYRQSPYPAPHSSQRSGSVASPVERPASLADRRHSTPAQIELTVSSPPFAGASLGEPQSAHPDLQHASGDLSSHPATPQSLAAGTPGDQKRPDPPSRQSSHSHSMSMTHAPVMMGSHFFDGGAMSPSDQRNMFVSGASMFQAPFYTYNHNLPTHPPSGGMAQTLSPSSTTFAPVSTAPDYVTSATSEFFPFGFDTLSPGGLDPTFSLGDGTTTPGLGAEDWDSFLNADALDDEA